MEILLLILAKPLNKRGITPVHIDHLFAFDQRPEDILVISQALKSDLVS